MFDELGHRRLRRDGPRCSAKPGTSPCIPQKPFSYRKYRPNDETQIMQACNETFGINRDENYWRWKFLRPGQAPMVQLAVDAAGQVLAQMAAWPVSWYGAGQTIRAAQVGDLFARRQPDVVRQHVMLKTFASFHHANADRAQLLFGFPNGTSAGLHGAGFSLLRGSDPINTLRFAPVNKSCSRSDLPEYPDDVLTSWPTASNADELWQRAMGRYPLASPRNAAWLRHRFIERPDVNDYRFIGYGGAGGRLSAWVITRPVQNALWMCDFAWDGESTQAICALLRAAEKQAGSLQLKDLRCWLQGDELLAGTLVSHGWETFRDADQIRLALYLYDATLNPCQLVRDLYLTRADSDLI